ncbi:MULTISPECIES: DNA-binding protein [unclassified Nostoc]|uniref:DNA-binding protein n=1 Tax=unclassified Nostoc TaxID=2593658 RepID=UPI002AD3D208|nr:DNA-binding protein [Nostoc sp. DedQUE07]MDZ8128780.1 DNA-binding protein [Nostoc sp. DedQUE07]
MNFNPIPSIVLTSLFALLISFEVEAQKAPNQIENLPNARVTTISGQVTKLLDDEFILNDGKGQIIVEAEPQLGQPINLSVGEQVTVVGNYDNNEFNALSITRANGETIQIHDD